MGLVEWFCLCPSHGSQKGNNLMQQLIFIGTGGCNLQLMRALASQRPTTVQMHCIAENMDASNPALLPEHLSNTLTPANQPVALANKLTAWGVTWIPAQVKAIQPSEQTIQLHDNSTVHYDWLVLNCTPQSYRAQIEQKIPGARENGFFVYPQERFIRQWIQVCQQATDHKLRISIIGDTVRSMEVALVVQQRLQGAAVTWLAPLDAPCIQHGAYPVLLSALKKQRVHVLFEPVVAIQRNTLHLQCGAELANDIPIIALEPTAPNWLTNYSESVFFEPPDSLHYRAIFQTICGHSPRWLTVIPQLECYYLGADHALVQWCGRNLQGRIASWIKHQKHQLGGLYAH
jgi:hypothetical protein